MVGGSVKQIIKKPWPYISICWVFSIVCFSQEEEKKERHGDLSTDQRVSNSIVQLVFNNRVTVEVGIQTLCSVNVILCIY